MRNRIGTYLIYASAILGMVACQQQNQQKQQMEVVTPATVVVNPAPASAPKTKPVTSSKPKNITQSKPLAQSKQETGSAVVQMVENPVRLHPLGRKVGRVPLKGKYVALTFDDGPHASLTRKAVEILNRHGAKGTFFMLGSNVARYKSIVKSVADSGHELGVHTWSHIKMNSSSMAVVDREINRTQNQIAGITGTYPRVMRPPYGATNKALVERMYNRYGMATVLWDVDTRDWCKPGVSQVINSAVNGARPGSIILVHDIHASTLNALEGIVTGLQAKGYKLVTVSQLLQLAKQEEAEEAAAKAAAEAAAAQQAIQEIEAAESATEQPVPQPVETPEHLSAPQTQPQPAEVMPALNLKNFMLNN